jgi:hypothetical protein
VRSVRHYVRRITSAAINASAENWHPPLFMAGQRQHAAQQSVWQRIDGGAARGRHGGDTCSRWHAGRSRKGAAGVFQPARCPPTFPPARRSWVQAGFPWAAGQRPPHLQCTVRGFLARVCATVWVRTGAGLSADTPLLARGAFNRSETLGGCCRTQQALGARRQDASNLCPLAAPPIWRGVHAGSSAPLVFKCLRHTLVGQNNRQSGKQYTGMAILMKW